MVFQAPPAAPVRIYMELEGARHEGIIIFSTSDKTLINWSDGDSVALLRPRDLGRSSHLCMSVCATLTNHASILGTPTDPTEMT